MRMFWKACVCWHQTDSAVKPPGRIEFLDRKNYRQRRLRDAARVLPLFGMVLMFLPLMWSGGDAQQRLTSTGFVYLFGLWLVLIVLTAVLGLVLRPTESETDRTEAGR